MRKRLLIFGIPVLALALWYLFLKPYDYLVTFRAKTFPGTINQTLKSWHASLDSAKTIRQEGLLELTQQLQYNDSVHEYRWELIPLTDTTTRVKVYAKDLHHSIGNKLWIPFSDTGFEKRTRKNLLDFKALLNEHLQEFKVAVVGEERLKGTYCACIEAKGRQFDKARGMMQHSPLLGTVLVENQVSLNGPPFLEITSWNQKNDSIAYNFCYPILRSERLPQHPEITYREIFPKNALKAIYNGNYITSDRAWYALLDYARQHNLKVSGLPIEVFHNNPNLGGDEMRWKAEIFMPLTASDE